MAVPTWIAIGAAIGLLLGRLWVSRRFPGGLVGSGTGGAAGAFLGGGLSTLAAGVESPAADLPTIVAAIWGAVALTAVLARLGPPPGARSETRGSP